MYWCICIQVGWYLVHGMFLQRWPCWLHVHIVVLQCPFSCAHPPHLCCVLVCQLAFAVVRYWCQEVWGRVFLTPLFQTSVGCHAWVMAFCIPSYPTIHTSLSSISWSMLCAHPSTYIRADKVLMLKELSGRCLTPSIWTSMFGCWVQYTIGTHVCQCAWGITSVHLGFCPSVLPFGWVVYGAAVVATDLLGLARYIM
jgi:hypothetical protein